MIGYVVINDIGGSSNRWIIEEETNITYKVFLNGYITEIYKSNTYYKNNILHSTEVRNPFCTIENEHYCKAEYCEIWIKD